MTVLSSNRPRTPDAASELATIVLAVPPARRSAALQSVVSFGPSPTVDASFAVGPLRAAFGEFWEQICGTAVPIEGLRKVLEPPVPIKTVLQFNKLMLMQDAAEIDVALYQLIQHLRERLGEFNGSTQRQLFESCTQTDKELQKLLPVGRSVSNLQELVNDGQKFPTIYADPPWPYENTASRAAAVNHYPTLSVGEICAEPIPALAEDNAHLHLWTTNAFLHRAFDVMDAWGFQFKSCLVWVKDQIGMGMSSFPESLPELVRKEVE